MSELARIFALTQSMIRAPRLKPDGIERIISGIQPRQKLEEALHWAEGRLVQTPHPWIA